MNRAKLKTYAPKARKDFLRAVSDRARKVGLTLGHTEPVEVRGDVAIIGGQAFPKRVADQRRRLDEQIKRKGFSAVMEEAAYTWFNRFMAIRYMELHGYLGHGYRVLSDPSGKDRPQILEQAEKVTLPGLDTGTVIDLKLDGTQDEALYKLLLLGQCHALHLAMPFLFERIDDQTELLLPDNLLASDSVIRKMVTEIAEADWERVEIIGWLYQFYISEKKDALMSAKKAYASEDIPAVTQLFTPNWIVKYMVQNSLGRQWLATYPQSPLRAQMEYYIEPAAQTDEVRTQLAAITPKAIDPEAVTLIDPACGSGHILVEAYDLYKEIYLERGYRLRDIPRLILEKNLFGLEIDDRAAQMAGFALLMKARADDPRILDRVPTLNVRAIQSSSGLDAAALASALLAPKRIEMMPSRKMFPELNAQPMLAVEERSPVRAEMIADLCALFAEAKTFGSLLAVPTPVAAALPALQELIGTRRTGGDLLATQAAEDLETLVAQAEMLARQHDVSVMNPPYLGGKGMNAELKVYSGKHYPNSKSDLFAMFMERGLGFAKLNGFNAMVTMQSWMFLSSYVGLRKKLLNESTLITMAHLGPRAFAEISGEVVQTTTFVIQNVMMPSYKPTFIRAVEGTEETKSSIIRRNCNRYDAVPQDEFAQIPGNPLAYWVGPKIRQLFASSSKMSSLAKSSNGIQTGDNSRFVRYWFEVDDAQLGVKWFSYNKGGEYRKWFGNILHIVNWSLSGREIKSLSNSCVRDEQLYFSEGITWSDLTSGKLSVRYLPMGCLFDASGPSAFFSSHDDLLLALSLLNTHFTNEMSKLLNPTLHFQSGDFRNLPVASEVSAQRAKELATHAIELAERDWNDNETSQGFCLSPVALATNNIANAFDQRVERTTIRRKAMREIEEENNLNLIVAYGLQNEINPEVPDDQITLACADREKDMQRLISYALGCIMGRYSLDAPGLIYAHSSNYGFDSTRYATFPADSDGILPLTETDWFGAEDTANRFGDFLKAAWPAETYHENVQFVADSLSPKAGEAPMDTIRRYLATGFYKDHLQTYKKRPIYWLFSSGKERAFQALVYLHRYNEGTLARMRMEYVVPLQSRLSARIEQLDKDIAASTSTPDRKRREGEKAKLTRQYLELLTFDEKLRHYADQRIHLDLDDGVKVNYSKFGDLLAEVKAITGDKDE